MLDEWEGLLVHNCMVRVERMKTGIKLYRMYISTVHLSGLPSLQMEGLCMKGVDA